ncbi:MAG: hypothetical protein OXC00_16555, partial [Acidimicrobiaceae bacterium]|nr:hypothetical protein [Acidimicrobiaceae bacterium]
GSPFRSGPFDGPATHPGDYTATPRPLTIHAGDTQATATVALTDDIYHEDPEAFLVRLNNPSTGAEVDKDNDTATGIILDDDDLPIMDMEGVDGDEWIRVREDAGTLEIRVTLNKPSDREIRVDYRGKFLAPTRASDVTPVSRRSGGPCSSPFQLEPGTLVFEPGAVAASVQVTILNDNEHCTFHYGDARRFEVRLSDVSNAVFPGGSRRSTLAATVSVIDVAIRPCVIAVGAGEVFESEGTVTARVVLSRTADTDITVIVETRVMDTSYYDRTDPHNPLEPATAGDDYTALAPTRVMIPRGSLEASVTVQIIDDSLVEGPEAFQLVVRPADAKLRTPCGERVPVSHTSIIDNDTLPTVTVADVGVSESAGTALFTVSLDDFTDRDVTVSYTTVDGTAAAPGDYTAASGTFTIDAGNLAGTIAIDISDDEDKEDDETFVLRLNNPSGATISDDEATATISDDEASDLLVVSIGDVVIVEGARGSLPITLSEPAPGPCVVQDPFERESVQPPSTEDQVSVGYSTMAVPSLGALAATPGPYVRRYGGDPEIAATVDFFPYTNQRVVFTPCETEAGLDIGLATLDGTPELDEKFLVVLHDPVNATIGDGRAWITIEDNDVPLVSVADVSVAEGAGAVTFTVALHAPGVEDASVRYLTVVQGSAGDAAATPDEDYVHTAGKLDIPAGTGSATITV